MPASVQSVIKEISYYLRSNGTDNREWFVGRSYDPLETIITKHCVDEAKDLWIYRECLNPADAINVLRYFTETLKCDGDRNTETPSDSKFIYVYKKNSRTTP